LIGAKKDRARPRAVILNNYTHPRAVILNNYTNGGVHLGNLFDNGAEIDQIQA
jgi:hypothetical protein